VDAAGVCVLAAGQVVEGDAGGCRDGWCGSCAGEKGGGIVSGLGGRVKTPVRDKDHLKSEIRKAVYASKMRGCVDLNHLDVGRIDDFSGIFSEESFTRRWWVNHQTQHRLWLNINISEWDVSNGVHFDGLFQDMDFNGDISRWSMGRAERVRSMFENSSFNGDISTWDVRRMRHGMYMFRDSDFEGDVSAWGWSQGRWI
jgi:Mycoplasma protein of unknown function, DUF285